MAAGRRPARPPLPAIRDLDRAPPPPIRSAASPPSARPPPPPPAPPPSSDRPAQRWPSQPVRWGGGGRQEGRPPGAPAPDYLTPILTQTRGTATQRRLRNTDTMTLPPNRTTSFQRSFIPDTTRLWNRLPQSIRASPSLATFKTALIKHIGVTASPTFYSIGTKNGNKLHTQLRTGTLPLNGFLFQTQKSTTPHCPCGFRLEDTKHFLLYRPLYDRSRSELYTRTSHITNNDFHNKQPLIKLQTLLHGHNLNNTESPRCQTLPNLPYTSTTHKTGRGGGGGGGRDRRG